MCREPKPCRAFTSRGNAASSGTPFGSHVGGESIPRSWKRRWARVLVPEALDHLRLRQQDERAELVAHFRELDLIEIGERDDRADLVLLHQRAQRRDVAVVMDLRHERVLVCPVEGRREGADIRGDGRRAGAVEGVDDVDALSGAREKDCRHGGQYTRNGSAASAEAAKSPATTSRARPGRRSSA
jgi:hypothetical protein